MKKFSILSLGIIATMGFAMQSCSEDIIDLNERQNNKYVQDFIKQFGKPDPNHTYSMAKAASVTVSTGRPTNVYVTSNIDGTNYCFAEYPGLDGTATLKFDLPRDIKYVNVETADGITIVPVGGSVILSDRKSRAEVTPEPAFTLPLSSANTDFTTFVNEDKYYSGFVSQGYINNNWVDKGISCLNWPDEDQMSGAEYLQYLDPHVTDGVTTTHSYIWNGVNEYMLITNLKRMQIDGEYKDFEVGRIYGNNQSLASSTQFTLIPLARSVYVGDIHMSQIIQIGDIADCTLESWTHTVVLDYDNRHISISGIDVADYTWFNYIFDDTDLETKLQNAAQHELPRPEDWYYSPTAPNLRHDLPLYPTDESNDEGKLAFFQAWDQFIQDWLGDHPGETPYQDEFIQIKALMATESVSTVPGALPNVTKDPESNKYYIKYYTSRYISTRNSTDVGENGVVKDILPTNNYCMNKTETIRFAAEADNESRTGSEYAIYMRPIGDNDPSHIVTSLDGRIKKVRRHLPQTTASYAESTVEDELLFFDYDGDGDYTDFIFRVAGTDPSSSPVYSWMLACEDLGTVGDYDFNDLVVGIGIKSKGETAQEIRISPMAAGAAFPLYLMWNDLYTNEVYVVGQEIHKWLDQTALVPFNTSGDYVNKTGLTVEFDYNVTDHNDIPFSFDSDLNKYHGGAAMQGFWVLVDQNNVLAGREEELVAGGLQKDLNQVDQNKLNQIIQENGLYKVANDGSSVAPIAKMIFVDSRWEWPKETVDIREAYPKFGEWVTNMSTIWYPIENNANTVKRK